MLQDLGLSASPASSLSGQDWAPRPGQCPSWGWGWLFLSLRMPADTPAWGPWWGRLQLHVGRWMTAHLSPHLCWPRQPLPGLQHFTYSRLEGLAKPSLDSPLFTSPSDMADRSLPAFLSQPFGEEDGQRAWKVMFISGCKNSNFLRAHHVPFTHPLCHSLAVLQGADSTTSISSRETERLRGRTPGATHQGVGGSGAGTRQPGSRVYTL